MDFEHANITKPKVPVLQGDELLSNSRVIKRNSSLGCSSRVFYYRTAEGVPFEWEMQPGTPKVPPKQDLLPPITPPPAVLSLALPKPGIDIEGPNEVIGITSRLKFWKYMIRMKIRGLMKAYNGYKDNNNNNTVNAAASSDNFERVEFCSSDGEFMASSRNSSFSSSSTSLSFSNVNSRQFSKSESAPGDSIHGTYGCSPWNFTSTLVSVARRA